MQECFLSSGPVVDTILTEVLNLNVEEILPDPMDTSQREMFYQPNVSTSQMEQTLFAQLAQLAQDAQYCRLMFQVCQQHADVLPFLSTKKQERVAKEYQATPPHTNGATTPTHLEHSIGSDQPLAIHLPTHLYTTTNNFWNWLIAQPVNIMRASADQLEHQLIHAEQQNEHYEFVTHQLRTELDDDITACEQECERHFNTEEEVDNVTIQLHEMWLTNHQHCSHLPADIIGQEPTQCISLVNDPWKHLAQQIDQLKQQLDALQLQQQQQPKDLLSHINANILEVSSSCVALHQATDECFHIFIQEQDWTGLLA